MYNMYFTYETINFPNLVCVYVRERDRNFWGLLYCATCCSDLLYQEWNLSAMTVM